MLSLTSPRHISTLRKAKRTVHVELELPTFWAKHARDRLRDLAVPIFVSARWLAPMRTGGGW
jgi:hypothetical protein